MTFLLLLAAAAPQADAPPPAAEAASVALACVPGNAIVPPFNNSPEAMDQARVAATAVMAESARAGGKPVRVCQTSAVAPEISEVEGVNEVPVDPDYEAEDRPEDRTAD